MQSAASSPEERLLLPCDPNVKDEHLTLTEDEDDYDDEIDEDDDDNNLRADAAGEIETKSAHRRDVTISAFDRANTNDPT